MQTYQPVRLRAPGGAGITRPLLGGLLFLWILLPVVPLILWSVAAEWRAPDVLPGAFSAAGLAALLRPEVLTATGASLVLGLSVALPATILGALAAFAARRLPNGWARAVELILLAPLAIPPFALVMGSNVLLLGARVPAFPSVVLVLTVTALPYTVFMFRAALASYDDQFEEVARTLGASPRAVLARVRIPLLARATARAAFLAFLVGWSDYITTLLVGGGQLLTLPMVLGSAASATGNEQLTAALSLAMIVPPLLLLALLAAPGPRRRQ
ncbi:ABC transporter permease subunit [Arthrobacter sp. 35/47]|uniref:ABC transporter permease n=1 Tax=Arthrobacter sp. 35/47 TaxID=269454 RepID=UPI0004BB5922|nr:ABC transporter permease subunit [Arthrobacter sp. 35/47]